ncbi:hypothetical protein [Halomonas sp. TD01]|nr:hypothetical protein [Halomonas sp. TD01]EGP21270.1 hypothetical protein GME_01914 [Halomonas sp. TD01]CAH1043815.1 hypothetical protein HPTD01_2293 [Halomonas sp. TD01]
MARACQEGKAIRRTIRSDKSKRYRRWYLGGARIELAIATALALKSDVYA